MRNMLSAAMWNLHGKVCGKPCRNVEKRVLHRWNLVELPLQAAVSSYLSEKENAMRVIRRSPERKALVLYQRSAQLSPNSRKLNRKSRLYRRIDLGRNGLNRHPDSGKIVRRSMASRRLRLQTASGPSGRTSDGAGQAENTIYNAKKDWTKKPLVRSSNSGKPEKSRANSGVRRARGERK